MDRGAWQATVHRVTESDTTEATLHASTYKASILIQYGNLIYICIDTDMIHTHIHMTNSCNDKKKCSYNSKRKINKDIDIKKRCMDPGKWDGLGG